MNTKNIFLNKKLFGFVALMLLISGTLFAYDFGVILSDSTGYSKITETSFNQSNTASVWYSQQLSDNLDLYVSGEYLFSASQSGNDEMSIYPYSFDLGLTYVSGINMISEAGVLEWNVGRILLTDVTSQVISGRADGVTVDWYTNRAHVGFAGYFTGLVNKDNTSVSMTTADEQDLSDDDILTAADRLVFKLNGGFSQLFLNQDLDIEFIGQKDLRDAAADSKLDSLYGTIALSGNPLPLTSYELGSTTALQKSDELGIAEMAYLNVTVYTPWKSSTVKWDTIYTVPLNDIATGFSAVCPTSLSYVVTNLEPTNTLATTLDFSAQLLTSLNAGLKAGTYFRTTEGDVNVPDFDSDSDSYYLGSEVETYFTWKASTELQFYCAGGVFLSNTNLSLTELENLLYRVSLSASLKI